MLLSAPVIVCLPARLKQLRARETRGGQILYQSSELNSLGQPPQPSKGAAATTTAATTSAPLTTTERFAELGGSQARLTAQLKLG